MPEKTIRCRICGKAIKGYDFPERMAKLRRHYSRAHPKHWRQSVAKSLATKLKRGIIKHVSPKWAKLVAKYRR